MPRTSVVDLVAAHHACRCRAGRALDRRRRARRRRRDRRCCSPEHLIAAAQAEHVTAAPQMRARCRCPSPARAGRRDRRWSICVPGMITTIGIRRDRLARRDEDQPHAGLLPERIEIVEIGDPRQHRHRDDARRLPIRAARSRSTRILGRQRVPPRGSHGTTPSEGQPVSRVIAARPSSNSAASPRNLLMMKPLDARALVRLQHRMRADDAGDHAAAIDVADQHDRHVGRLRQIPYWRCRRRAD